MSERVLAGGLAIAAAIVILVTRRGEAPGAGVESVAPPAAVVTTVVLALGAVLAVAALLAAARLRARRRRCSVRLRLMPGGDAPARG